MEVDPITPAQAADRLATWLAVRDALEAVASQSPDAPPPPDPLAEALKAIAAEPQTNLPLSEPVLPGADSDFSHEAATVQTTWRAPAQSTDALHAASEQMPVPSAAHSEFAVPAALLVPAMLTGLRIQPAAGWQLPPGAPQWPASPTKVARRGSRQSHDERQEQQPPPDEQPPTPPAAPSEHESEAPARWLDAAESGPWCETLSHALRGALAARIVPQALLAAAEQWKRGRCVVLACPQADDPAGPAWAFVLWPLAQAEQGTEGVATELALHGLRVEARLHWSAAPRPGQWCHVRVVKEHHPRHGRQLVALEDGARPPADRPVACEVQLGPVLARSLRWCEVRVRIQAAQRFWAALGQQWSVHVVVCALPLLSPPAGSPPC